MTRRQENDVILVDHCCKARECATKDAYVLEAKCMNCGWTGEIAVTVGHEASGMRCTADCPQCECRRLYAGNFVRRMTDAERKRKGA